MASTTVAQLAAELNRPPAALLEQLQVGRRQQGVDGRLGHRERQGAPARSPALGARHRRERRAQEDHADAQVDQRDQAGRFERQGAHDPGRGAQEAHLRQARRGLARLPTTPPAPRRTRPSCAGARKRRTPRPSACRAAGRGARGAAAPARGAGARRARSARGGAGARPRSRGRGSRARLPLRRRPRRRSAPRQPRPRRLLPPRPRPRRGQAGRRRREAAPAEPAKPALRVVKAGDASKTRKSSAPPTWPSAARPPRTRPPPSAR